MAVISSGGDHLDHAAQQPGRTHAAGQGGDHRGRPGCRRRASGAGIRGHQRDCVPRGGRAGHPGRHRPRPPPGSRPAPPCARLAACRSDLHPPTRAGCPSGSTPPPFSVGRPASAPSAPAPCPGCPAVAPSVGAVSAFAVSWRRRRGIAARGPGRGLDRAAGHAGPTAPHGLAASLAPPGGVVHRAGRRGPRLQLRGARRPGAPPGW